ncbi:SWR1 complex subunit 2 isoform X2 [Dendrobium catenatum]|uniref:SWR1 complex subunit 2 isoform X2 n=1 Tax=Dendrobium catenatum TaxID=906689 RepID=UPI0009F5EE7D|nr:SWR1 complex subunit 2 isoform X2 [Dendrobium catenatum]
MADPEEQILLLERSSRLTRGKRMTKLLDEEIEEDERFWNQDALKDEENDDNYKEEQEVPDEFDSDFEEDEPEQEDEAENPAEDRFSLIMLPVKKRLIFPGKQVAKKKNKKKVLSKLEYSSKIGNFQESHKPTHAESQDATDELEGERTVRKSTRTSVIVRQAERDAIRAALQATMKPIKRKKEGDEKRMTQEEMLLEAAQTEIMNLRNLERVLAREEEVKKRAVVNKAECEGPQIRFTSRNGKSLLDFMKGSSFKSELHTASAPYSGKSLCVVTGLPAKYRDPKTGLPYATIEAFKIIRERFFKEEAHKKKQVTMDTGDLLNLISGQECFSFKRKRSGAETTTKPSDWRLGARFRRIPALENLDLD